MGESFKRRMLQGERLVVFSAGRMYNPNIVKYVAMAGGFDGLWIDAEHTSFGTEDIESAVTAAKAYGLESFVRIPPTDYAVVTRCFESGAVGVMAAQISSASQAEAFVQWSKFSPRGHRGLNSLGLDGAFGSIPLAEFTERANRDTFVAIQIETLGALAEVREIALLDGVDMLFVGPSDLGQALGHTGDLMHPDALDAIDRVAAACAAAEIAWGAVTPTPDYANLLMEKGCTVISPTNDVKLVVAGLEATKERFAQLW